MTDKPDIKKWLRETIIVFFWFAVMSFPLIIMKVSVIGGKASVLYRFERLFWLLPAIPVLFVAWKWALSWRERQKSRSAEPGPVALKLRTLSENKFIRWPFLAIVGAFALSYPLFMGLYHTNVMVSALLYIILGLGLNIVVGLGGLLNLGYAAFFAVGAYTYGLSFKYLGPFMVAQGLPPGLLFWVCLPLGGLTALIFGVLVGLPVLRLRGDYLAIITLAFGEIVKIVLQNMTGITGGATGISLIPRPWFFGVNMTPKIAIIVIYYIAFLFVLLTIVVVRRLENSRTGRAWEAMREDEIASRAMGINIVWNKLSAFALSAMWAGFAGVIFAAQTTYINPDSFSLWESVWVLCIVVLGGTGSIPGVIVGALILKLLPEYLRFFSNYRMITLGLILVLMMIFKPDGILPRIRRQYILKEGAPK
jgi:branched-chain amino acid transport system permease protein